MLTREPELIAVCLSLIDEKTQLSEAEAALARTAHPTLLHADILQRIRALAAQGADPLGDLFLQLRSAAQRRTLGAVYTPQAIIDSMVAWASTEGTPARVVDPGAGSGRFLIAAAQAFPNAMLIGIEIDPLASLILRANMALHGLGPRTQVHTEDFRELVLPDAAGPTLFLGNPPYVRHHDIGREWKTWYQEQLARFGVSGSSLAGLHLHFFVKTLALGRPGDFGAFITAAEWMDVNYGSALRELLLAELGGRALHVLEPSVEAFPGTATTAAVTCFKVQSPAERLRMRSVSRVSELNALSKGRLIASQDMREQPKWSVFVRPSSSDDGADTIELGELFRVHRGQVTGANRVWIAGAHSSDLPASVQFPSVTKARDLILAGEELDMRVDLKRVIDIPTELDGLPAHERKRVLAFLDWARSADAHSSYIAQHRKAWWSVGLREAAPILCTYMARRPPQFTLNVRGARHINIAHGLYPREQIPTHALRGIVGWLNRNVGVRSGRIYSGGLVKFEPREIERIRIPVTEILAG